MKYVNCLTTLILIMCFVCSACSIQNEPAVSDPASSKNDVIAEIEAQNSIKDEVSADHMPLYLGNEQQLVNIINAVKEIKNDTTPDNAMLTLETSNYEKQSYNGKTDVHKIESVESYYRPSTVLSDMSLYNIAVNDEYISLWYCEDKQSRIATFTWFRIMTPEIAMNELFGRGAMSEREIEYRGIKYVILEWWDPDTKKSGGFSVHWIADNVAFQASITTGYSDEEILAFCQIEKVTVG